MDKRVIFAVAGAGKTTHIINSLSLDKRSIIVTYTENNYHHLRHRIIQKFGFIPETVTVLTYFTFLYSFCYKPFLHDKYRAKGINWNTPPAFTLRLRRSDKRFYIDSSGRLYSNRIAKLIEQETVLGQVQNRLSKYYDQFFVDEMQDFGGHDFNLLKSLCSAELEINYVGDFYQHTFDTSRDGNVNKSIYNDFEAYQAHFHDVGIIPDTTTLSHSYRCTPQVCAFITEHLGINIQSHKDTSSEVLFLTEAEQIREKFLCNETVKLFFQNHMKYPCLSQNWGKSKGQDHYTDVCIMLYPAAMKAYKDGDLRNLKASSRNKLYVACTRANNNVFFIEENQVKQFSC
ncbi:MAG: hypothetical protein WD032_04930 [Nitrospirales bacterium]